MSVSEVACTYAALILWDDGIPVTYNVFCLPATIVAGNAEGLYQMGGEKISTLVKAAKVPIEAYWPGLFAKLLEKRNIEDLLLSVGSGGGGGAAPIAVASGGGSGAAAAEAAPAVEEKKEEPKEESDEDMGFSLFD